MNVGVRAADAMSTDARPELFGKFRALVHGVFALAGKALLVRIACFNLKWGGRNQPDAIQSDIGTERSRRRSEYPREADGAQRGETETQSVGELSQI